MLIGAEALLRWKHPDDWAIVPPSVFIEVAEQSGLIEAMGRNVLRRPARDAAGWSTARGAGSRRSSR